LEQAKKNILAPDFSPPGDNAAIDNEKLVDIFLFVEYTLQFESEGIWVPKKSYKGFLWAHS